jgi:hypothetical protein
LEWKFNKKV